MVRKSCPDRRFERCQCGRCAREACGCLYTDKLELPCPVQGCGDYLDPARREAQQAEQMKLEEA